MCLPLYKSTSQKHLPGIDKMCHHPLVLEHGLRLEKNNHVLPSAFPNVELPLFEYQNKIEKYFRSYIIYFKQLSFLFPANRHLLQVLAS